MATSQVNSGTTMTCPRCNAPIKAGLKFCPVCGTPLAENTGNSAYSGSNETAPAANMAKDKKGKRKLIIIAIAIIAIFVLVSKLNSPVNRVKSGTLEDFGSQTIGEMVDDNFKKVKWTYEKLDGSSGFVCAEGYCVTFQETMCLEFYYDKDSGQFLLKKIDWLDRGESDSNLFSMALTLGMLYS